MKKIVASIFVALNITLLPSVALAADAITLIFKSGQIVKLDDGYRQIVNTMKSSSGQTKVIELELAGGSFLLNLAEVVVACRDNCSGLTVQHQLDPRRGRTE